VGVVGWAWERSASAQAYTSERLALLSSPKVEHPVRQPIRAELVPAGPKPVSGRQVTALLLAAAPLVIRAAWWWRSQPRRARPSGGGAAAEWGSWEHTELRMTKRLLGRWKVRVVSTRWHPEPRQADSAEHQISPRSAPLVRAVVLGLEWLGAPRSPRANPRTQKLTAGGHRPD